MEKIYVPNKPGLSPDLLNRGVKKREDPNFGFKRIVFYPFGRNALYSIIKEMKISRKDSILLPNFVCHTAIRPFEMFTKKVRFFRVRENLSIDFDDLADRIEKNTKVLMVVHYHGFTGNIERVMEICRDNDIYLIEDCAQAMYSRHKGKLLGSFGDASVFSIRKTLPVPDGGALVINNEEFKVEEPSKELTDKEGVELRNKKLTNLILTWLQVRTKFFLASFSKELEDLKWVERRLYSDPSKFHKISDISRTIMNNVDSNRVIKKHRKNFNFLSEGIEGMSGIEPIFKKPEPGVCPYAFPLMVKNRKSVRSELLRNGIETLVHWDYLLPKGFAEKYPEIEKLARNEMTLPVHQDLERKHMESIVNELKKIAK
ncbi:MAG: aminotransferase class V-fold PLP-dependent enzyme [Candidatus Aenigmarchaeota archaeon]|nr:aminotransferase class V-fold PLP-dependent enzyme [Candidatus Aenigmarchaeota archaeon]